MKSIATKAVITGVRSRADRSLGLSISTPELSPEEAVLFMTLQNVNINLVITPLDEPQAPQVQVEKDLETKSLSERMRGVLFILFKQQEEYRDFDSYYRAKMEAAIERLKTQIEPTT